MTPRALPLLAILSGLSMPALAQDEQNPILFPPPMISVPLPPPPRTASLVDFVPGAVRCGSELVEPVALEAPFPVSLFIPERTSGLQIELTFRIDADGRPLGIAHMSTTTRSPVAAASMANADVIPAFAASRFRAGKAHADCRIGIEARPVSVAQAPLSLIRRYLVSPHRRQTNDRALFERLHPEGTTCTGAGAPQVRLRAYPDFDAIPQRPGTWSYAMTAFDIDASGKPIKVRIADSDGNKALDQAAIHAVQQSRFDAKARQGCTYPYFRRATEPLQASPMPDRSGFAVENARCPEELGSRIGTPPLTFPPGFQYRRIEGWAVIAYDVAPWGQRGNARVLAAEPAAAFGEQARLIVGNARQAASETGGTGCLAFVRFVMPAESKDDETPPD